MQAKEKDISVILESITIIMFAILMMIGFKTIFSYTITKYILYIILFLNILSGFYYHILWSKYSTGEQYIIWGYSSKFGYLLKLAHCVLVFSIVLEFVTMIIEKSIK